MVGLCSLVSFAEISGQMAIHVWVPTELYKEYRFVMNIGFDIIWLVGTGLPLRLKLTYLSVRAPNMPSRLLSVDIRVVKCWALASNVCFSGCTISISGNQRFECVRGGCDSLTSAGEGTA